MESATIYGIAEECEKFYDHPKNDRFGSFKSNHTADCIYGYKNTVAEVGIGYLLCLFHPSLAEGEEEPNCRCYTHGYSEDKPTDVLGSLPKVRFMRGMYFYKMLITRR